MRSANVRADAIVFNSALSAYARNRLTLWKPRALAAARHARAAPSDTRDVTGAGDTLSQRARRRANVRADAIVLNSALSAYERNRCDTLDPDAERRLRPTPRSPHE